GPVCRRRIRTRCRYQNEQVPRQYPVKFSQISGVCENSFFMSESIANVLQEKIRARTAQVGIVGLGYVGLPLAVEFAKAGFSVTGIDVSEEKTRRVNAGDSYISDIPTGS